MRPPRGVENALKRICNPVKVYFPVKLKQISLEVGNPSPRGTIFCLIKYTKYLFRKPVQAHDEWGGGAFNCTCSPKLRLGKTNDIANKSSIDMNNFKRIPLYMAL
jgi:hypothetical protein